MDEAKTIRGLWRMSGEEAEPVAGTLNIESDSLVLSVWKPQNISFEAVVRELPGDQPNEVSEVISGFDENRKPVTLFGCGIDNLSISGGMKSWDIGALAVVQGLKISSWNEPVAGAVRIELEYLNRWFNGTLATSIVTDDKRQSLTLAAPIDLEFALGPGVRIRFVEHVSRSASLDEQKITARSSVWFQFDHLQSLHEITDEWLPWVRSLFGLLIGVTVKSRSVELFIEDPYEPKSFPSRSGMLFMQSGQERNRGIRSTPDSHRMVAPFESVRDKLGSLVSGWNRVFVEQRPVIDLFSSVAFHHALYSEARFLFLVQALEIYHSRSAKFASTELPRDQHQELMKEAEKHLPPGMWTWAQGKLRMNFRSLKTKLLDIFEAHLPECEQLFSDVKLAASRIAYTRNHLTHYSEEAKASRLMSGSEMWAACWQLESLIWVILLREIGLDGSPVKRIMHRATGVHFVNLED